MTRVYIGIDPGVTGAISLIDESKTIIEDLPVVVIPNAKRKEKMISPMGLKVMIESMISSVAVDDVVCVLEKTQAMKDTAMTAFSMGQSRGIIIAVLELIGISRIDVAPVAWKKHFSLLKCDKAASQSVACTRRPQDEVFELLKRKKDHNRAESLLLSLYGKEKGL